VSSDAAPPPPSPSVTSTLVATQENHDEITTTIDHTAITPESHEEPTPPSPIPPPKSPSSPKSAILPLPGSTTGESMQESGGGDTDYLPDSYSVPGGFLP
jgi:hypothetical protein